MSILSGLFRSRDKPTNSINKGQLYYQYQIQDSDANTGKTGTVAFLAIAIGE